MNDMTSQQVLNQSYSVDGTSKTFRSLTEVRDFLTWIDGEIAKEEAAELGQQVTASVVSFRDW